MAEALLKKIVPKNAEIKVASAGVQATPGLPASAMTLKVLSEEKVLLSNFQSQGVTQSLMNDATYVFAMTQQHRDFLIHRYPQHQEKVFLITEWTTGLDIPDPIGGSMRDYQECCAAIKSSLEKILPFITEENFFSENSLLS